jgi:hypothetical protein
MGMSKVASALKLPKKAYFMGSVILGILLFSADEFLEKLSLFDFKGGTLFGLEFLYFC